MDFPNLKILILDGNQISSLYDLPYLFALENLSINNNKLKNVNEFSNEILEKCPKIKTISKKIMKRGKKLWKKQQLSIQ